MRNEREPAPWPIDQRELAADLDAASRDPPAALGRRVRKNLIDQKTASRRVEQGFHGMDNRRSSCTRKHFGRQVQGAKQRALDLPGPGAGDAIAKLTVMALQQQKEIEETIEVGTEFVFRKIECMGEDRVGRRQPVSIDTVVLKWFAPPPH